MKKKNIILNIVFLLVVTGLTIYYLATSGLFDNLGELKNLNLIGIIVILLFILIYVCCDSLIIRSSMKIVNDKATFTDAFGAYAVGNLGSNVTPWKIGHFPFSSYYYYKKGYNIEEILTIVCNNHMIYSTCLIFIYGISAIIALVNNFTVTLSDVKIQLYIVGLIGASMNVLYLGGCILLMYNKSIQRFVMHIEEFFLVKLKKIDSVEKFEQEKLLKMEVYRKCFYRYTHEFYRYIIPMLFYCIFILCWLGLPYVIYLTLSKSSFDFKTFALFFSLCQGMSYVSNIIPVPGGTGVAEFSFLQIFASVMGNFVSSAMFIWRILTYFAFIIVNFIYLVVFIIINSRKEEHKI